MNRIPETNDLIARLTNASPPLLQRRHFSEQELEGMPTAQLKHFQLYPDKPEPVDIDLLADEISQKVDFCELADDILGATEFRYGEKPNILLNEKIFRDETPETQGRNRFVIAHECGHIIMQDALFQTACKACLQRRNQAKTHLLSYTFFKNYSNYVWYEWQANTAGAHLLMPPEYVHVIIQNTLQQERYDEESRSSMHCGLVLYSMYSQIRDTFNVSYTAACITCERYLKKFGQKYANLLTAIGINRNH